MVSWFLAPFSDHPITIDQLLGRAAPAVENVEVESLLGVSQSQDPEAILDSIYKKQRERKDAVAK